MVRPNITAELTPRQAMAWQHLTDPAVVDVLYGGAKGGGKSWLLAIWAYCEAWRYASAFKLPRSKNPIHIGWIGRKQGTDFTRTTLQTWRQIIPEHCYELKGGTDKDPKHILIDGRIAIDYGGLDRQEQINQFNSAEYAFFGADQAEEMDRDDISVLRASRRLKINGKELDYKGLFTANPRQCWLKDDFIVTKHPGRRFVQALPGDNPHLPKSYVDILTEAFKYRPELLKAYLNGDWDAIADPAQIISEILIAESCQRARLGPNKTRFIACDPARFGDDECVVYEFENTNIINQWIWPKIPSDRMNLELHKIAIDKKLQAIVIDESGMGGPVVDWQRKLAGSKYRVIGVQSEAKAVNAERYHNVRAEMWMESSRMFADGEICMDTDKTMDPEDWRMLRSQLCTPTYDFRGQRFLVQPKSEIKTKTGRSPDRADCAIMGWYKYPQIAKMIVSASREKRRGRSWERSAMAS